MIELCELSVDPTEPTQSFTGLLGLGETRNTARFHIRNNIAQIQQVSQQKSQYPLLHIPMELFYGVALRCETPGADGSERVSLYLVMDDPDLALPIFHGPHHEGLLPFWYEWQDLHGLTAMVISPTGEVADLVVLPKTLEASPPQPRRMSRQFMDRRPGVTRRDHFVQPAAQSAKWSTAISTLPR